MIALTVIIGLGQLGIDVQLLGQILAVLVSAVVLALALAFGLGAGPTVANIIALRNLSRHYQQGQRVRIDQLEGEILELSKTTVILDTEAGRAMIPAKTFQEKISVLLDETD